MRNSDGIEGKPREAYQAIAFSENRCPPRIKCGAGFFGIMLYPLSNVSPRTQLMIPGAEFETDPYRTRQGYRSGLAPVPA